MSIGRPARENSDPGAPASAASDSATLYRELQNELAAHKRAEEALRESEERFRGVLNNSAAVISVKDIQGKYQMVNSRFEEVFGLREADVLGKTDADIFSPEVAACFQKNDAAVVQSGRGLEIEELAPHPEGAHTYLSVKFPLRTVDGSIYAVAGISTDITERKRVEENNARLAAIVEHSDDAIVSKDLNGIIRSWNRSAQRLFGYTAEEAIGKSVLILIPPGQQNEEPAILGRIRAGEIVDHYETIRRRKDGTLLNISLTVSPIRNGRGEIIGASKIARDITERKRVEAALRRSEVLLRELADSMPQMVWAARPDGYVDYYNKRWYDYTGSPEGQFGEDSWVPLLHPDDMQRCRDTYLNCIRTEQTYELEYRLKDRRSGAYRWFLGRALPIRDENGQVIRWFGTCTDIDDQKRAEETLERAVVERTASLRDAVAQMEEFSYTVSHDLRAPLRGMQAYSEALLQDFAGVLPPPAQHYLKRIAANAERLDKMILDVLTFSRLARAEIDLKPVNLDRLVRHIVEQYPGMQPPQAQIDVEPLLPVLGHEPSLTQAISNLLNNAVKFVASNVRPHVRVWTEQHNGRVQLRIQDNGIGIAPAMQHRLFRMFERIHPDKQFEGTGVGLAIVRKAVTRVGGSVGVTSDGQSGSLFWIELQPAP